MTELQDYIEEVLSQIEKGQGKHHVWGTVQFDIATAKKVEGKGKIGVSVLGVGGEIKDEVASRIKFRIRMRSAHGSDNT